jgi:putative ABC transport system permease protein
VATLIVGVVPAIVAAFTEAAAPIAALAGAGGKGAGARGDRRIRSTLAAVQVGITVVLLAGAALIARDVIRLLSNSPGFDERSTFAVILNLPTRSLPTTDARAQYVQSLVDAVKHVPGIEGVSTIQSRFILNETMATNVELADRPPTPGVQDVSQIRHVMPDVFRVLGIRILRGRGLDSTDRAGSAMTAVVSSSFARQYWPGENAIGKRLRRAGRSAAEWMTVVGVAEEINDAGAGIAIGPTLYVPYLQQNTPTARVTIVARARVQPSSVGRAVRQAIWKVNPAQAVDEISALSTLMSRSAAQPRFQAVVVGAFGVSALILVLAGIYALTLFSVLGRAKELAVRAALGASPSSIISIAVSGTMRPVVVGAVLGTLAAMPVTRLMKLSLGASFGAQDLAVVGGVIAILIITAASASWIPARRAASGSPAAALRA